MSDSALNRRRFMQGTLAATTAGLVQPAFAQNPNGESSEVKVRVGIIGTGGRGTWIGKLFHQHGGYEVTVLADYFQDRVDGAGDALGIPAERRFTGLSGYKRMLEGDLVDAVAIISPPCFHPQQSADAVDAGKHVYLAKPIAVDVPGVRGIEKSAAKAKANKLAFLIDFQTRVDPFYIESIKRVHDGALGRWCFGEAYYHAGRLGRKGSDDTPEGRLRNWVFDIALSGDILVEQNVHTLDVMSWVMNAPPLRAVGTCGRKSRTDVGDCNDHFNLHYVYPDDVGVIFGSKQYNDGATNKGIVFDLFGSDGRLVTKYGGNTMIFHTEKEKAYRGGRSPNIYTDGAVSNIAGFHAQITKGDFSNPTVEPSVRSHLVALMGRKAAYTGDVVTWEQIVDSTETLQTHVAGLKG